MEMLNTDRKWEVSFSTCLLSVPLHSQSHSNFIIEPPDTAGCLAERTAEGTVAAYDCSSCCIAID